MGFFIFANPTAASEPMRSRIEIICISMFVTRSNNVIFTSYINFIYPESEVIFPKTVKEDVKEDK